MAFSVQQNKVDTSVMMKVADVLGVPSNRLIVLTFPGKAGVVVNFDPASVASERSEVSDTLLEFGFSFQQTDSQLTAKLNDQTLAQSIPVSDKAQEPVETEGVINVTASVATQAKALLGVSEYDPILCFCFNKKIFQLLKSEKEFNDKVSSINCDIEGSVMSDKSSSVAAYDEDGCTTYYYTIGGYTYTVVVCD